MSALESCHEWMIRAKSSFAIAIQGRVSEDIVWEDLCYEAEQASEKALKALCILHGVSIPRTHNIGYLLELIASSGVSIPEHLQDARILTEYSVETRYPGVYEPVTEQEYYRAIEITSAIFKWAESQISSSGL